jgi:hypothetical protein
MASRLFTVDLDLGLNKAKRFIFEDFSTNPSTDLSSGRIIYFTGAGDSQNHLKLYNGTAWKTVAFTDDVPTIAINLDAPDLFTVSGSPANASGTLAFEWNTAAVNTVLAGPDSGSTAAIPTFRSLVAADIPSITASKISNFQEAAEDVVGSILASSTHSGISVEYGDPAGTLQLTNTDKGSDQNIFKTIAVSGQDSVVADSNTDTLTIAGSTGLTVTTNATTDTITLTNSGVTSVTGTTNEITVSGTGSDPYTGAVTIGLPDNVTIAGKLTVTGDLQVDGTTTTLNTETLAVEDNIVLLNKNVTGTPSANAGIEVERGTSDNASILWNETTDKWTAGITGSEIAIARKYVTTTTGTTHTITHGLATSDVTVNCWLAGAQVEAAVVVTDDNTVTVTTNSSITDLKTVVVG